jgi:hypothetical protein
MGETGTEDARNEDGQRERLFRVEILPGLLRWSLVPFAAFLGYYVALIVGQFAFLGVAAAGGIGIGFVAGGNEFAGAWALSAGIVAGAIAGLGSWVGLIVLTAPNYRRAVNAVACAAVAGFTVYLSWTPPPIPNPNFQGHMDPLPLRFFPLAAALVFVGINAWLRHAARTKEPEHPLG